MFISEDIAASCRDGVCCDWVAEQPSATKVK